MINLDRSRDRMQKMSKQLNALDIPFERFSAVPGKDLSEEALNEAVDPFCSNLGCNKGMIGCALSHTIVLKSFLKNSDDEFLCVMEDDLVIKPEFKKIAKNLEKFQRSLDFDMISLYCIGLCGIEQTCVDGFTFTKPEFPLSLSCYIVNRKGAEKVLGLLGDKILYHVDFSLAFSKLLFGNLNYYVLSSPQIIDLNDMESTMGSGNKSILLYSLNRLNLKKLSWMLNVPAFCIKMDYTISVYMCLLIVLLLIALVLKWKVMIFFVILELSLILLWK